MNKTKRNIFLYIFTMFLSFGSLSAEINTNLCNERGIVFGFFNGVQTSPSQANEALIELSTLYGERSEDGDKIQYELFYNYSNGFEDFVETFEQRLKEQNGILVDKFELFFQAYQQKGSWWEKIIQSLPAYADFFGALLDDIQANAAKTLTSLLGNPPTLANYAEHRSRIDSYLLEGRKLLFFAHSQGNLFATSAYDYAVAKSSSASVKVVHVAPASPTLRGEYTLANLDLVINGLRLAGSVPAITNDMPGYLLREPGLNGQTDFLGHGLLEIYLNGSLDMLARITTHVENAFSTLEAPDVQASTGFFTVTLTWDGYGDVDLHTYEPNGSHVYYSDKIGQSGYLDVDNTQSNGPEHYYASCNQENLSLGIYQIKVANYARANGRIATLQIASWDEGVLETKSVTMGDETGDYPAFSIFSVKIDKDSATGKYTATLQ